MAKLITEYVFEGHSHELVPGYFKDSSGGLVEAIRVPYEFRIWAESGEPLYGKPNDFVVKNGTTLSIVYAINFYSTFTSVDPAELRDEVTESMSIFITKITDEGILISSADITRIISDPKLISKAQKTATTRCRSLTQKDFDDGIVTPQRHDTPVKGHIYSLESKPGKPTSFKVGDMLAEGVQKELWRITLSAFKDTKVSVTEPDNEGWALYVNTNVMFAVQMSEAFECKLWDGSSLTSPEKSWLVFDANGQQPVADDIFRATYNLLP